MKKQEDSAKNLHQLSKSFGYISAMINWELILEETPAGAAGAGHAIGNYIVDFVCIKRKLIIELDGLPSVATPGTGRIRQRKNNISKIVRLSSHSFLE